MIYYKQFGQCLSLYCEWTEGLYTVCSVTKERLIKGKILGVYRKRVKAMTDLTDGKG